MQPLQGRAPLEAVLSTPVVPGPASQILPGGCRGHAAGWPGPNRDKGRTWNRSNHVWRKSSTPVLIQDAPQRAGLKAIQETGQIRSHRGGASWACVTLLHRLHNFEDLCQSVKKVSVHPSRPLAWDGYPCTSQNLLPTADRRAQASQLGLARAIHARNRLCS